MVKNILYNDLINDLCRNEKIKSLFLKKKMMNHSKYLKYANVLMDTFKNKIMMNNIKL